jgi:SAM-dependent methyltransferase
MIHGLRPAAARVPSWLPGEPEIARCLAAHHPLYRHRKPRYQVQLLRDVAALMPQGSCRVLDIGAGTGLIGQAISELFPAKTVMGVDLTRRLVPTVGFLCETYDGCNLPFADASFDCALFCNVLHHVDTASRARLMRDALRVTAGGPLIVKDHLAASAFDRLRLRALDAAGNVPFGGMVNAHYLAEEDWSGLLSQLGCTGIVLPESAYRSGVSARCFPNRLEICFSIAQAESRTV